MKTLIAGIVLLTIRLPAPAQELTLRAGELLSSSLEEPNFFSATAEVGEPVVCYLSQFREFGHSAFPRGTILPEDLPTIKPLGGWWAKARSASNSTGCHKLCFQLLAELKPSIVPPMGHA